MSSHQHEDSVGVVGLYRNRLSDTPFARAYRWASDERFRREAYARPSDEAWVYWAGNCSVTRPTFDRVGGYDPIYSAYGWEDIDYGYRLHQSGVRVVLAAEAETTHHVAAISTQIRMRRSFYSGSARRLFDAKHPKAWGTAPQRRGDAAPSLWERLVAAEANLLTAASVERVGAAIDRALPFLPHYVAEKLVASGVEAASLAGQRTDGQLKRTF